MVSADNVPENLLITQKKLSLACESIIEPAPIARIASVLPQSPDKPKLFKSGATIEAAVIIAMVDDPCEVFRMTAIMYGINNPNPSAATCSPRLFRVCLKTYEVLIMNTINNKLNEPSASNYNWIL